MNVRKKGIRYELEVLKDLETLGFDNLKTSRNESRVKDAEGNDIVSTSKSNNPLPWAIQCKSYSKSPNYPQLFANCTSDLPLVIFHKYTKKATKNFVEAGQYVILSKELFYDILNKLKNV